MDGGEKKRREERRGKRREERREERILWRVHVRKKERVEIR